MSENNIPENLVFGLDIGTRSVVGTVGYRKPSGQFVILAQRTKCHETRSMLDGQIHDIGRVAETVEYIKELLEHDLSVKLERVCIAAAGRVLKTVTVRMDYELGDEMTITNDMIFAMELMGMEQANNKLRSMEKDGTPYYCVGYSIVKYYLGNTPLTNLEGHKGSKIGADVLATFLPREVIDGLHAVCDRAGLKVENLTLEPIAAMNIAIPEKFRLLNLALVDVGAGTSDICITKQGSITGYGMLPCAGDFLTESIMYALLTDFATAEEIKLAFSANKKKISYKDVMGDSLTVDCSEIAEILQEPLQKLTGMIADKILELNCGEKVGAIFIVGGGGKNPEFASLLADATGLPKQRVALRGEEVFTQIISQDGKPIVDSMLVTPIGICLNYYEQNNNFIIIKMNGNDVKLYDNGKLNVMDATIGVGMSNEDIFPKRGASLHFTLNGEPVTVKGRNGDSAVITVNSEPASVTTPIRANDVVNIIESTVGEKASMRVSELAELKKPLVFLVNGKKLELPRTAYINGKPLDEAYEISEGDDITVPDYYTLGALLDHLKVTREFAVVVNNRTLDSEECDRDEKIYEHYIIDLALKREAALRDIVKDARDVLDVPDGSDGETVIDDSEGNVNESYEEYLDRRYGRNQYRSVSHEEPEEDEEGREGYGRFGKLSGFEINSMIRGDSFGDTMDLLPMDFTGNLSKASSASAGSGMAGLGGMAGLSSLSGLGLSGMGTAAGTSGNTNRSSRTVVGSTTDKAVNDELIRKLQAELAEIKARQGAKSGSSAGLGSLGTGSTGFGSLGTGSAGFGSLGTGSSAGHGGLGIGSAGLGSMGSEMTGSGSLSGLEMGSLGTASEKTAKESAPQTTVPSASAAKIVCTVNGQAIVMDNKPNYIFVDILDHYSFDTSASHGDSVVMKVNGSRADFFTPINDGDMVDLYWDGKAPEA